MVCTLGNRRKFEEVQRCLDVIGFSHEVTETMLSFKTNDLYICSSHGHMQHKSALVRIPCYNGRQLLVGLDLEIYDR